jgi:hypothetical protein
MIATRLVRIALSAAFAALTLGCDDTTGPAAGAPAALMIVAGDQQRDTVGQELAEALVVRVVDADDNAVPGQVINFRVIAGGGSVFAGVALTDSAGEARERWTLGTVAADTQVVEARAVDTQSGEPLVFGRFHAVGVADVAATVVVTPVSATDSAAFVGGDSVLTGDSLTLTVVARDRYGNLKPDPAVTWATSDAAIASVSAAGMVRVLQAGPATITARVDTAAGGAAIVGQLRVPVALEVVGGAGQSDTVDATLATPLAVRALDRRGRGFAGAEVTFLGLNSAPTDTTPACGCKVVLTGADGSAATAWVLGVLAGDATMDVTGRYPAAGALFDSLRAMATVLRGAAANMTRVSGGGSATGLIVAVRDRHGNPVSGVVVAWAVTAGAGSLSDALTVTNVNGLAGTSVTSATGTVTVEASAPGLTGSPVAFTITSTPSFALDFNQSFITVSDHPDLDLAATWTIEAWIKPRSVSGGDEHVISKWGGCADASYSVVIAGGKLLSGIASCANGTQVVQSSGTLVDDQWQHIALTLSNDSLRLYINGVLDTVRTGSQAPLNTATDLSLGRHAGGLYPFDGLLDEVRIWTVARSAAQIAGAMNSRLQGNETGLVAYWRFDEGSGDTAFDTTGRGHSGQLGSAVGPDANDPQWTTDTAPIP